MHCVPDVFTLPLGGGQGEGREYSTTLNQILIRSRRFSSDPAMQEKVKARQRFLDEQQLLIGGAYYEGETKGREKRSIEVAQNLKRLGAPLATIAEATGLSLPEAERFG